TLGLSVSRTAARNGSTAVRKTNAFHVPHLSASESASDGPISRIVHQNVARDMHSQSKDLAGNPRCSHFLALAAPGHFGTSVASTPTCPSCGHRRSYRNCETAASIL